MLIVSIAISPPALPSVLCFASPHLICSTTLSFRALPNKNNGQEINRSLGPHYSTRSASKFLCKVHKLATAQFQMGVRLCTCQASLHLSFCQAPPQHILQTKALPTHPPCAHHLGSTQGCRWSQNTKASATRCL